jgi:heptaprenyl diphosphate synthase
MFCNIREKKGTMMAKKTALLGMLVALAFVLSYIETLIPINLGIPGAKLGLANLVVMVALYTLGTKEAFALSMVRILLTGLTFSSMAAMFYSFAGGLLSFAMMYLAKRSKLFSAAGVSVLGGISHNAGQIFVAMWVLDTATLIYYLPVLAITGIASGTVIGLLAVMVIRRVSGMINRWD